VQAPQREAPQQLAVPVSSLPEQLQGAPAVQPEQSAAW